VPSYGAHWFEKSFVDQFPYGRGGPSETRRNRASLSTLLQHYPRISTNNFLGYEFQLHSYDHKTRADMTQQGFVKVNVRTAGGERQGGKWGRMTAAEAIAASKYLKACADAAKAGATRPAEPKGISEESLAFIRSLKICLGEAQHTEAFVEEQRLKLFAMMTRHGTPQWW
jgi:hypothetical protein